MAKSTSGSSPSNDSPGGMTHAAGFWIFEAHRRNVAIATSSYRNAARSLYNQAVAELYVGDVRQAS